MDREMIYKSKKNQKTPKHHLKITLRITVSCQT